MVDAPPFVFSTIRMVLVSASVLCWWQIYVICFLTTQSHLISLHLLWMSTFWNVSMKICHCSLNFLLYFFCHLNSASWSQGIASFSGSYYTFYLQIHLFMIWKHPTKQIYTEREMTRLSFVAHFTFLWISPGRIQLQTQQHLIQLLKYTLLIMVF